MQAQHMIIVKITFDAQIVHKVWRWFQAIVAQQKTPVTTTHWVIVTGENSRKYKIRTCDLCVPNAALYQAELISEKNKRHTHLNEITVTL